MLYKDKDHNNMIVEIREGTRAGKPVFKIYINGELLHIYSSYNKARSKVTEYIRINDWRRP